MTKTNDKIEIKKLRDPDASHGQKLDFQKPGSYSAHRNTDDYTLDHSPDEDPSRSTEGRNAVLRLRMRKAVKHSIDAK